MNKQELVAKFANEVMHIDAWEFTQLIPQQVVQLIVTSPPFYGKRFYPDTPDRIFNKYIDGEAVRSCDPGTHKWYGEFYAPTKMGTVGSTETKKHKKLVNEGEPRPSQFCSECDAWKGQLGMEPHPSLFIEHLVDFFRPYREDGRLRDDGLLCVNMGDAYAGSGKGAWKNKKAQKEKYVPDPGDPITQMPKVPAGYKKKDRMMIPAMLAQALRADGWYLRSEVVWNKPAPLPSGVLDRPADTHEFIYILSKEPQYYYDHNAIREPYAESSKSRYNYEFNPEGQAALATANPFVGSGKIDQNPQGRLKRTVWTPNPDPDFLNELVHKIAQHLLEEFGDLWTVNTRKSKDKHTAGYPVDLILPCILAGSSRLCCPNCYAPWKQRYVDVGADEEWMKVSGADSFGEYDGTTTKVGGPDPSSAKASILKSLRKREVQGWIPTCSCGVEATEGSIVLDPFGGTGTTGEAALKHGRRFFMSEASSEYCDIARKRLIGMNDQEDISELSW